MALTATEKMIRHQRKRKGILVPMLEDFMRTPVVVEDERDVEFLTDLLALNAQREAERGATRVFSPSSLAECLRQVFLLKHHAELEIAKAYPAKVEPSYYFLTGNFLHLKWQFALQKMSWHYEETGRADEFEVIGHEIRVMSKHGDHGGTIDTICRVEGTATIVDYKGVNVRTFAEATRDYVPRRYTIQTTDYMMLYNSLRDRPTERITRGLILFENKGGPDANHPLALHEYELKLKKFKPEVRERLEVLREHEQENSIPPPECKSTSGFQFNGCPFAAFCKKEVKEIEARRRLDRGDSSKLRVAVPKGRRNNRPRRNST